MLGWKYVVTRYLLGLKEHLCLLFIRNPGSLLVTYGVCYKSTGGATTWVPIQEEVSCPLPAVSMLESPPVAVTEVLQVALHLFVFIKQARGKDINYSLGLCFTFPG